MAPPSTKLNIAFLGLGIMGSGMAARLLKAGFPLTVFNRNRDKATPLIAAGARIADSPRDAALEARVIISMVSDDNAARAVWLGERGALAGAAPGAVVIESSTVTLGWVRELFAAAQARQCEFLDAPVTGSRTHAAAGELNFLVGGESSTLEKVKAVLSAMSRTIVQLGPVGSGALVKLINNFVCGVQVASLAEAVAMVEHSGLDREKALEVILGGAPGSPLLKTVSGRMTTPDYTPNFLMSLMAKDLGYAALEASKLSVNLATAPAALEVFKRSVAAGLGDKDMAAVVEQFRK